MIFNFYKSIKTHYLLVSHFYCLIFYSVDPGKMFNVQRKLEAMLARDNNFKSSAQRVILFFNLTQLYQNVKFYVSDTISDYHIFKFVGIQVLYKEPCCDER